MRRNKQTNQSISFLWTFPYLYRSIILQWTHTRDGRALKVILAIQEQQMAWASISFLRMLQPPANLRHGDMLSSWPRSIASHLPTTSSRPATLLSFVIHAALWKEWWNNREHNCLVPFVCVHVEHAVVSVFVRWLRCTWNEHVENDDHTFLFFVLC